MIKNWKFASTIVCFVLLFSATLGGCKKNMGQKPTIGDIPSENPPIVQTNPGVIPSGLYPQATRQYAPDFNLPNLDGSGNLSLASLKGKIVLIDFTTTWCIWCTRQEPQIVDLHKKYESKGFTVIAIDCREPKETVFGKYPGGKNLYPVILDEDGNVSSNLYGVQGYPYYQLIDKEGKVAYVQSGYKEDMFDSVSKMIDYLMVNEP